MPIRKLLASAMIAALVALAMTGYVDDQGKAFTDTGIKRALVAFGIARGLNAIISTAQGTEIAVEPMGIGVTLTPGQLLDPVNDLIERLSWVLLASATALTIQELLLAFAAGIAFNGLLLAASVLTLVCLWTTLPKRDAVLPVVAKITLALLIIRFTVPAMALTSETLYQGFLANRYDRSIETMSETSEQLTRLSATDAGDGAADKSFVDGLVSMFDAMRTTGEKSAIQQRIAAYRQVAESIADRVVTLIAVFVMQTLLIPLAFLWLALYAVRNVFARR
tara:strand:- start:599 stop:1435 length:837 start_codon:yes stop_codon:yes gene_type:complete